MYLLVPAGVAWPCSLSYDDNTIEKRRMSNKRIEFRNCLKGSRSYFARIRYNKDNGSVGSERAQPVRSFNPAVARVLGAAISVVSVGLSTGIGRHFFKSYSFSGPGYLLGLPVGFASLGASSLFKMTSLLYSADLVLHPAFFWIQMSL
jgi:hypothetical protein